MSGSVAMPHPSIARTLVHSPGWLGRYVPMTHETESPRNVIRGSEPDVPCVRPLRSIGTYSPTGDTDVCGRLSGVMTTGDADRADVAGGAVLKTTTAAAALIASTVTPIGKRFGRPRCAIRVSAPRRIGRSMTK